MKISEALADVKRLYIDAAPLVYYVEENSHYVDRMDVIVVAVEDPSVKAFSSVVTLTEVLTHPLRLGQHHFEQEYRGILLYSDGFQLLPVTIETADIAAHLRARYNLRTPDALHVATAMQANCDVFLTNDTDIRRVTELRVLLLDELQL